MIIRGDQKQTCTRKYNWHVIREMDYERLTVDKLKALLTERHLNSKGRKVCQVFFCSLFFRAVRLFLLNQCFSSFLQADLISRLLLSDKLQQSAERLTDSSPIGKSLSPKNSSATAAAASSAAAFSTQSLHQKVSPMATIGKSEPSLDQPPVSPKLISREDDISQL